MEALGVEGELDELQRRYRMMESDRKAYADEVQNVVRKQKAQIDKLKRENGQLKSELQLQARNTPMGDGSMGSSRVARMQDQTDQITRSIESEKKRSEEIDLRTRAVKDGILQERRDMGGNNAPQEQNQAIGKQIKARTATASTLYILPSPPGTPADCGFHFSSPSSDTAEFVSSARAQLVLRHWHVYIANDPG